MGMATTALKAIETIFKGYRFRSRLEARWAVFYEALGIDWRYEDEGFDLDGSRYLPDFYLPHLDCFIEIKGKYPADWEYDLCAKLAAFSGKRVYLFYGNIPSFKSHWMLDSWDGESAFVFYPNGNSDGSHTWCECDVCGGFGIEYRGWANRILCPCRDKDGPRYAQHNTYRIYSAYEQARAERFGT